MPDLRRGRERVPCALPFSRLWHDHVHELRGRAGGGDDVVLRHGESATAEEILQFLRERISSYKLPSAVEFRAALPRSFIGKVLRRVLVEGEPDKEE